MLFAFCLPFHYFYFVYAVVSCLLSYMIYIYIYIYVIFKYRIDYIKVWVMRNEIGITST